MLNHTCSECGFHASKLRNIEGKDVGNEGICRIFGHDIHLDGNVCSKFNANPYRCDNCSKLIVEDVHITVADDGSVQNIMCEDCSMKSGTCLLCEHGGECLFQTDSSPLPLMVKKQIRQGNMISVVTIPNPERIEITCKKSCPCFSQEFGCCKQSNQTCGNYEEV